MTVCLVTNVVSDWSSLLSFLLPQLHTKARRQDQGLTEAAQRTQNPTGLSQNEYSSRAGYISLQFQGETTIVQS